jgi:DNA (cytosine-5)-methyltransferase 1
MVEFNKKHPLRVFTAFSGYDSQCMALNTLKEKYDFDYDLVGWSEIDKYAIQAHDALFPQWKDRNYGDISKIDWDNVPDFDLFTYSSPCFVAGTFVMTKNGMKCIEDITCDDEVLTHKNKYRKVLAPMSKTHGGVIIKVTTTNSDEIKCTPTHPFYVKENLGKKKPKWKYAQDLQVTDYVGVAINNESKLPRVTGLNTHFKIDTFWFVLGMFLGRNWGNDNSELAKEFGEYYYSFIETDTAKKYDVEKVVDYFKTFGSSESEKHLTSDILNLPIKFQKEVLHGIIESEEFSLMDHSIKGSIYSTNRKFIYELAQCVAKSYQKPYIINEDGGKWKLCWIDLEKYGFYEDGYFWSPVKQISSGGDSQVEVYNMEVDKDNSYTANGCIVHNCTDFSQAGLQLGGTEGSGTRSSLLWECRKTIIKKRPKYLLFENVKALVSDKFIHLFQKWCKELESYGYVNFYQVLNAKDYGIPQNRERIFMISILKTDDEPNPYYEFPEKIKLKTEYNDYLEDEPDESYYMPQERAQIYVDHLQEDYPADEGLNLEKNEELW